MAPASHSNKKNQAILYYGRCRMHCYCNCSYRSSLLRRVLLLSSSSSSFFFFLIATTITTMTITITTMIGRRTSAAVVFWSGSTTANGGGWCYGGRGSGSVVVAAATTTTATAARTGTTRRRLFSSSSSSSSSSRSLVVVGRLTNCGSSTNTDFRRRLLLSSTAAAASSSSSFLDGTRRSPLQRRRRRRSRSGTTTATATTKRFLVVGDDGASPPPTTTITTTSPPLPSPLPLRIYPDVSAALKDGRPVCALESTIVAHGMPYPENWNLCRQVSRVLREKGVVPATIAVSDGTCRIGLSEHELHELARTGGSGSARKCSTRDVPLLLAQQQLAQRRRQQQRQQQQESAPTTENCGDDRVQKDAPPKWGATTVASTMVLAHLAGIPTFVTGGIGGVHRNGHVTMDVSADLLELGRTPVVVVSAGIKSILDVRRTLEVLETQGVPAVAYRADEFPAFFSPRSGVGATARVEDPEEVAAAYWSSRDLGLPHGMLVAVPNDDPAGANVEAAIQAALAEAEEKKIAGPAVTPYVLNRVAEATGGDSLRSNMALVERNAAVGADIAVAIADEKRRRMAGGGEGNGGHSASTTIPTSSGASAGTTDASPSRVVVLGGIVMDIVAKPQHELLLGTSNPASCTESDGGVGRNIAEVLGRLGDRPVMYSAVGKDSRAMALLQNLVENGRVQADNSTVRFVDGANTATYVAVLNDDGDLHAACADMSVFSEITPPPTEALQSAEVLVMDANPPIPVLREAARRASELGLKVYLDPTSVSKATAVARDEILMKHLTCAFPNMDELRAMAVAVANINGTANAETEATETLGGVEEQARLVLARMNSDDAQLVITMGERGVLLATSRDNGSQQDASTGSRALSFQHFSPPVPQQESVLLRNATGAGDTLCGAFVHAVLGGDNATEAVQKGMKAALLSLSSDRTISDQLYKL